MLVTEGQRIYQQRFPHSDIERITVFELAHELSLSFTQPRNITYDRFLLFTCKQKQNEKLESFHSRLKALGAKCRLGTAHQVLQFALNRERGQENQKAINTQLNRNRLNTFEQISNIMPSQRSQAYNPRPRFPAGNPQPQRNFNTPNPCRRCGLQFMQTMRSTKCMSTKHPANATST